MSGQTIIDDLQRYGPSREDRRKPTLSESQNYCRRLAKSHYENFSVTSLLLPRQMRPHFYHVYAYCRWADDLADETGSPQQSLELLAWWQEQLDMCFDGWAEHPVFVALSDTIKTYNIPKQPLADLLSAFRQDQHQTRYETVADLLDYCRRSANPVGRVVLYLGRCFDEDRAALSDEICTGLQLANFCQDVARDWGAGRVYLPQSLSRQYGYDETMFLRHDYNDAFIGLLRDMVDRAECHLRDGLPLVADVPKSLRFQIDLFARGGLAILRAIRRIQYNVWYTRPHLSAFQKGRLVAGSWFRGHRTAPESCKSSPATTTARTD